MDSSHGRSAFIGELTSGAWVARCLNTACSWNGDDLRDRFDPGWRERRDAASSRHREEPSSIEDDEAQAIRDEQAGNWIPSEPPPDNDAPPPDDDDAPKGSDGYNALRAARDYVRKHCMHSDGPTLRRWRGQWYRWSADRAYHIAVTDEAIDSSLYRDFGMNRPANVRDVRAALIGVDDVLIDDVELGNWIGEAPIPCDRLELVATSNGLLHLPTRTLYPATPRYFATTALGVVYAPAATQPSRWLAFLRQLWPTDDESIALLQEWIGYLLTLDTRQQKILLLIGPPRSGKGTIMRVITALLGDTSVCGPTLASLGMNFGLQPLIGKSAAIISDARLSGRSDIAQIVERLLALSGEDAITIDRKFLLPWTGYLSARMMLVSNELPSFTDASAALASRFLILELTESFLGKEDPLLTVKCLAELPGILLWALEGWERLRQRGYFVQPKSSAELADDIADLGSPVKAWIRERCDKGIGKAFLMSKAFEDYLGWAAEQKHKNPLTKTMFGRNLRAAGVKPGQIGAGELRGQWVYKGIERKPDLKPYPDPNVRTSQREPGSHWNS